MSKELENKICSCGTCETATMRAIQVYGKMMDDSECDSFGVAVGIALAAVASRIMMDQIETQLQVEKKISELLAVMMAPGVRDATCNSISEQMKKWLDKDLDDPNSVVVSALNVHILRNNERYEAEKNLPKGD